MKRPWMELGAVALGAVGLSSGVALVVKQEQREVAAQAVCVRAEQHGAVADDGADDRVALQFALDAASAGPECLDLGPGRFDVTRPPLPRDGVASLTVRGTVRITGNRTELSMMGSGVRPGEATPGDWVLMQVGPGAANVTISGIGFDGSRRGETEEQTHLLQVRGPASDVTIEHDTFNLPAPAAGDCIRVLGEFDAPVRNTTIRDVFAPACYRSFLGLQRGAYGGMVERVETVWVGDQVVDSEATGGGVAVGCRPAITDWTFRHSIFRGGSSGPGIAAMSIGGRDCSVMDRTLVQDVVIEGGGLDILDVGEVTLEGLHVQVDRGTGAPTLLARKRVGSLVVRDSTFVRGPGASAQPVIQVSAQAGQRPASAVFSRVRVEQHTRAPAMRLEWLDSLVLRDARLDYRGVTSVDPAISALGTGRVTMTDVVLSGPWAGIAPGNATLDRVTRAP